MPAGSPIDNSPNIDAHNIIDIDIISQVKGYTLRVDKSTVCVMGILLSVVDTSHIKHGRFKRHVIL